MDKIRRNALKLSIIIPAHNEEENIGPTIKDIAAELRKELQNHHTLLSLHIHFCP